MPARKKKQGPKVRFKERLMLESKAPGMWAINKLGELVPADAAAKLVEKDLWTHHTYVCLYDAKLEEKCESSDVDASSVDQSTPGASLEQTKKSAHAQDAGHRTA